MKWLVVVLAVAMALQHLKIGAGVVQLAFGILFGGIVFALALAVGLGSKDLVTRSLEREATTPPVESVEEPFRQCSLGSLGTKLFIGSEPCPSAKMLCRDTSLSVKIVEGQRTP